MAEYIEREKVKDELRSWAVCLSHPEHLLKEDALCVIDSIPAADAVPVVRCKDCKYYKTVGLSETPECWNTFWNNEFFPETTPDDFCSHGERRDSDG